ncbi:hypothetical protein N9H93_05955 [Rhizobiaceae bacterium]|nr:hypothetical protein [Rhizobiaceae bacterium]
MELIYADFPSPATRAEDERIAVDLQLHEQMLSCLDFVIETAGRFRDNDVSTVRLQAVRAAIGVKRDLLVDTTNSNTGTKIQPPHRNAS